MFGTTRHNMKTNQLAIPIGAHTSLSQKKPHIVDDRRKISWGHPVIGVPSQIIEFFEDSFLLGPFKEMAFEGRA